MRNRNSDTNPVSAFVGCGCAILILAFNLTVGYVSFSYDIWIAFGKQVPFLANLILGVITAEVAFPLAIVFWLLGVHGPLFK